MAPSWCQLPHARSAPVTEAAGMRVLTFWRAVAAAADRPTALIALASYTGGGGRGRSSVQRSGVYRGDAGRFNACLNKRQSV